MDASRFMCGKLNNNGPTTIVTGMAAVAGQVVLGAAKWPHRHIHLLVAEYRTIRRSTPSRIVSPILQGAHGIGAVTLGFPATAPPFALAERSRHCQRLPCSPSSCNTEQAVGALRARGHRKTQRQFLSGSFLKQVDRIEIPLPHRKCGRLPAFALRTGGTAQRAVAPPVRDAARLISRSLKGASSAPESWATPPTAHSGCADHQPFRYCRRHCQQRNTIIDAKAAAPSLHGPCGRTRCVGSAASVSSHGQPGDAYRHVAGWRRYGAVRQSHR